MLLGGHDWEEKRKVDNRKAKTFPHSVSSCGSEPRNGAIFCI
jgi:hypothetical protein